MLECALIAAFGYASYKHCSVLRQYTNNNIRDFRRNMEDRYNDYMEEVYHPRLVVKADYTCVDCKKQFSGDYYHLNCLHPYCRECFFNLLRYKFRKQRTATCHFCFKKYFFSNFIGYGNPIYIVPVFHKGSFYRDPSIISITKPICGLCGKQAVNKRRLIACHCAFCEKCIDSLIERDNEAGRMPKCPTCHAPTMYHHDKGQFNRRRYYLTEGVTERHPKDDY